MGDIPYWVYSLAQRAEPLEKYMQAAAERRRARELQQQLVLQEQEQVQQLRGEQKQQQQYHRRQLQKMDSNREMIDHAMAARVQRTFRKNKPTGQR